MPAATPAANPQPIQFTAFTAKELSTDAGISRLNLLLSQYTTTQNSLVGAGGPTILPSGVDVQGSTVTGLGTPSSPSDAVSLAHGNSSYGPAAVSKQVDLGGAHTLIGLSALYISLGKTATGSGLNATISLAKLTGGGSNGSITIQNGLVTGFVQPT